MKKITLKLIPLVLSVLIAAASLSGCTLFKDETTVSTGEGMLTLYGTDPHTLDPALSGDSTSNQYVTQIFSGLFRLDNSLEPRPDIVKSWDISPDGTVYTFNLRKDVKFHDGTPLTASDIKYSWERTCNPLTGSRTAKTYLGDIAGVNEVLSGKTSKISGIRIVNDYTLEVTLDAPRSYFLYKLTYPTTFIIDKKNVATGGNWALRPNGTGPFKLTEWTESQRLVLESNRLYYGSPAKLDSVVFLLWGGVPMVMYETGEIDVTSVPVSYIDKVTNPSEPFYNELFISQKMSLYYIGFNVTEPPFDDINVRRAFSMAIDRKKITSLIFRDMAEPAFGILPPGMPGFNEELDVLDYDPEQARQLLAESKYGSAAGLPPITLTTPGLGAIISSDLEAIIEQWKTNLGVELEVRQLEPERYIYNLSEEKDSLFDIGWIADYPHPQDFLSVLFESGSAYNYGTYNNPEINALLAEAGLETDRDTSFELYRQAEVKLIEDAACVPLWFGEDYYLVKPYVSGFFINGVGIVMLDEVSIDK